MKRKLPKLIYTLLIYVATITTAQSQIEAIPYSTSAKSINNPILLQIDSIMRAAKSNGILIINNIIIKEWEYDKPKNTKIETQSITKSMVGLLLGIALDEGIIKTIDDKVYTYFPQFEAGPYTEEITFKHLVTISSGIEAKKYKENYGDPGNMPPGRDARYHNDHFHQLARALTYIFEKPLINILQERILNTINASVEWSTDGEVQLKNGKYIPVNAGYAFIKWTSEDLAKIGQLYLNGGKWGNKQMIAKKYIDDTLSPITIPLMVSRPNQEVTIDSNNTYGYAWRGIKMKDNTILWYMSGNGGQFCVIIPQKNLVFVKINGYSGEYKPYRGLKTFIDALTNY